MNELRAALADVVNVGLRTRPSALLGAAGLAVISAIISGSQVVGLAVTIDALLRGAHATAFVAGALVAASMPIAMLCERGRVVVRKRLEEEVSLRLQQRHLAVLLGVGGVALAEDAALTADREHLRRDRAVTGQALGILVENLGFAVRIAASVVLLGYVHWALLLTVPLGALAVRFAARAEASEIEAQALTAVSSAQARAYAATMRDPDTAVDLWTGAGAADLEARHAGLRAEVDAAVRRSRWSGAARATLGQLPFAVGLLGAIVAVTLLVDSGRASLGSVVIVIVVLAQLTTQLSISGDIGRLLFRLLKLHSALVRLEFRLSAAATPPTSSDSPLATAEPGLRLAEVSFSYPGGEQVLAGIDAVLPSSGVVAIVGENGSGKSTLVKLLLRLYEPQGGTIVLDGEALTSRPAVEHHQRCASSLQDFGRFEFALRESVGVGDLAQLDNQTRVAAAIADAGADTVVERLPDGLNSRLGRSFPDGCELSGGEWQRVALARTHMRQTPRLLVADEPTASLDAETERDVYQRLTVRDRTLRVLVTHRLASTRSADLILVMSGGQCVDIGTHDDLTSRDGLYRELYHIQMRGYQDEEAGDGPGTSAAGQGHA